MYDIVWDYVVPLSILLLLFQVDITEIWRLSYFFLKFLGTFAGAIVAFLSLQNFIPQLNKITAMMTGSYTGGGVNFAAIAIAKVCQNLIVPI